MKEDNVSDTQKSADAEPASDDKQVPVMPFVVYARLRNIPVQHHAGMLSYAQCKNAPEHVSAIAWDAIFSDY